MAGLLLVPFYTAHSQSLVDAEATAGLGDDAMPGVMRVDSASPIPSGMALSLTSGYGYTGADLEQGDKHHRGMGRMVFSYGVMSDLAVALRLDGRYDKHFGTSGRDDGWVGDPRLLARYRTTLSDTLAVGAQFGFWAPSSDVPSIIFDALSVEALTSLTYGAVGGPLQVSVNAGYRLDRSGASVEEPMLLSLADRLSLGLSDYNAVLVGLGVSYRIGKLEALAEWSLDLLHGAGAPRFRESPMRAGIGARYPITDTIDIFGQVEARLSAVDSMEVQDSLFPFEPSLQTFAGLHLRFGGDKPAPIIEEKIVKIEEPLPPPPPPLPPTRALTGVVKSGETPIANATLVVKDKDGKEKTITTGEDGSFTIDELLLGGVSVSVKVEGYEDAQLELTLSEDSPDIVVTLEAILPPGQLRGVVRSFRGKPLKAELTIMPANTTLETADDGGFEIDLPPGDYTVTVTVDGFKEQTRQIHIDEDGVTIMNVDLRK